MSNSEDNSEKDRDEKGYLTWKQCFICEKDIEQDTGFSIVEEMEKESFHVCSPNCMKKLAEGFSI